MSEIPAILDRVFMLTGRLNYVWTNTESVLIHILAGLLGTDKDRATIVFLTLNTTRARIDLVERLAKLGGLDPGERDAILACTRQLGQMSGRRNHYNHCIYSVDADSGHARTILMRVADRKTDIRVGRTDQIDDAEIRQIEKTIADLSRLNLDLWQLIQRYDYPV